MLSRLCGLLAMKRETFHLATHYLDHYLALGPLTTPTKLAALGSLTLALKMDDAEMTSKFCLHYLYNPERTVKKSNPTPKPKLKRDNTNVRDENK